MELVQGGCRVGAIVPTCGVSCSRVRVIVPMWGELLQGGGDCTYVG